MWFIIIAAATVIFFCFFFLLLLFLLAASMVYGLCEKIIEVKNFNRFICQSFAYKSVCIRVLLYEYKSSDFKCVLLLKNVFCIVIFCICLFCAFFFVLIPLPVCKLLFFFLYFSLFPVPLTFIYFFFIFCSYTTGS